MNSDIRLDTRVFTNPKTKLLERELGDAGVITLLRLWIWVAMNRHDGDLSGISDDAIEVCGDWPGERGRFVNVASALRWLDGEPEHRTIHQWADHQPWAAESEFRSNKSRLLRIASFDKPLYDKLISEGCQGVSKSEYKHLTARQRGVNGTSTVRQRPEQRDADSSACSSSSASSCSSSNSSNSNNNDDDSESVLSRTMPKDHPDVAKAEATVNEIVTAWNAIDHPNALHEPEPCHYTTRNNIVTAMMEHSAETLLNVVENYGAAVNLPNSKAGGGKPRRLSWLMKKPGKYLPGEYNPSDFTFTTGDDPEPISPERAASLERIRAAEEALEKKRKAKVTA